MLSTAAIAFFTLCLLYVQGQTDAEDCSSERDGLSNYIISSMDSVEPLFYYVLKGNCVLYFSRDPLPTKALSANPRACPFRGYHSIVFRWDENSIGIVMIDGTKKFYCTVVDVKELISKGLKKMKMGKYGVEFPFGEIEGKITFEWQTCHRQYNQDIIRCYAVTADDKMIETVISYGTGGKSKITKEHEIRVPTILSAEMDSRVVISYVSKNHLTAIGVLSENREVVTVEMKEDGSFGDFHVYGMLHNGEVPGEAVDLVYADAFGMVSRTCTKPTGCFFRYNALNDDRLEYLDSRCLYEDIGNISPGVLLREKRDNVSTTVPTTSNVTDHEEITVKVTEADAEIQHQLGKDDHAADSATKKSSSTLKCANEEKESKVLFPFSSPKAYFALLDRCELYFSNTSLLKNQIQEQAIGCKFRADKAIVFDWRDHVGIILMNVMWTKFSFIDVGSFLDRNFRSLILGGHYEYALHNLGGSIITTKPQTCTGKPDELLLYCYAMLPGNTKVLEMQITVHNKQIALMNNKSEILLPPKTVYEPEIASYTSSDGETHLWVKHRNDIFYNFNIDELKRKIKPKSNLYKLPDDPNLPDGNTTLVYASDNGLVAKKCSNSSCFYVYYSREDPTISKCLFKTDKDIIPGILMKIKTKTTTKANTTTVAPAESDRAYVPIILLGVVTFIYLCFFFFFAFKPHPHSNLAELSTIVEDEISQLSILANKAVRSIKKGKKAPSALPPLMLMKLPDETTQQSLEEVRCPGATCDTYSPKRSPVGGGMPLRRVQSQETLAQRRATNTNARSNTTMPDQGNQAQLKSIRQLKHSTMSGARTEKKPSAETKTGRKRQSPNIPLSKKSSIIMAPVRSV